MGRATMEVPSTSKSTLEPLPWCSRNSSENRHSLHRSVGDGGLPDLEPPGHDDVLHVALGFSDQAPQQAEHFISGFDRPNIQYRIEPKDRPRQQLLRFLREEHPDSAGVVYCLSRNKVDITAQWLRDEGFTALPYHAGLPASEREANQNRFLRDEGVIVVATIAFGMGIDKPDVRFVAHLDMPKSVEAYYQETGRAGRDGQAATALLLYGFEDVVKLRQMGAESQGSETFRKQERQRLDAMLALCEAAGHRVEISVPQRGDRRRLMEQAQRNAAEALDRGVHELAGRGHCNRKVISR